MTDPRDTKIAAPHGLDQMHTELVEARTKIAELQAELAEARADIAGYKSLCETQARQLRRNAGDIDKFRSELAEARADRDTYKRVGDNACSEALARSQKATRDARAELAEAHTERDRAQNETVKLWRERDDARAELAEAREAINKVAGSAYAMGFDNRVKLKDELAAERGRCERLREALESVEGESITGAEHDRAMLVDSMRTIGETARTALDEAKE